MQRNSKEARQTKILEILKLMKISDQEQLLEELRRAGIVTSQSTVSRDLGELGVFKADHVYRLPGFRSRNGFIKSVETAGPNLIILKTPPGQASMVTLTIDHEEIPEIAGTLAGDDTIFAAVKEAGRQRRVLGRIQKLFQTWKHEQ